MSTLVCSTTANMDNPHVKLYLTLSGDNGDDKMRQNRKDVNFKAWDDLERKRDCLFRSFLGSLGNQAWRNLLEVICCFQAIFFFFSFFSVHATKTLSLNFSIFLLIASFLAFDLILCLFWIIFKWCEVQTPLPSTIKFPF